MFWPCANDELANKSKTMKKLLFSLLLLAVSAAATAQAVSKLAAKLLTKKKSDLGEIAVTVGYYQNLYPAETGTMTVKYMKKSWKAGEAYVGVVLLNKAGVGLVSLDGEVRIDGQLVPESGAGSYMLLVDGKDPKPREVVIKSAKGQEARFTVSPMPIPKIKSVNGKSSDIEIDLAKDLDLELELSADAKKYPLALAMLVKIPMGIDFSNFQLLAPTEKVRIPAASLQSKQISGGGKSKSVIKFQPKNFLRVESFNETIVTGTPCGAARVVNGAYATIPVKVVGKDESKNGIFVKGESEKKQGKFEYWAEKPNSYYAPAITNMKKVGLASLSVSGVLFKQTVSTSSSTNYSTGIKTTTTVTTTYEFPKLPDATWNNLVNQLYADLEAVLKARGVNLVGPEKITAHPAYNQFFMDEDTLTKVLVQKNYKGTKRLAPTSLGEVVESATSTYTADYPQYKIMNDLGYDGLLIVSLDLRVGDDGKKHVVLHPVLSYQLIAKPVYPFYGMITPALRGTITGEGISFSKKELDDPNCLKRIAQTDWLKMHLEKGIDAAEAEAKAQQYEAVWKLQLP